MYNKLKLNSVNVSIKKDRREYCFLQQVLSLNKYWIVVGIRG